MNDRRLPRWGKAQGLLDPADKETTMQLEGSNVLITGGSRGLGFALGRQLARAGARVALVARDRGEVARAAGVIAREGGTAFGIAADVADKDAAHVIAGQAAALLGHVDVLINNASTLGPVPLRALIDTDCEDLERVLAVNLVGPFRLSKVIVGAQLLRRQGVILNVSSDAAVEHYRGWGAYGASKAALDHLTGTWAAELADSGVRLLAVDPGEMNTAMHAAAVPEADPATLADPDDVAALIVALLRDESRWPAGSRIRAQEIALGAAPALFTSERPEARS
jgi:NAD(P)-dependent dehydrogenase (short-subunit alcohol dehydrogenase family)